MDERELVAWLRLTLTPGVGSGAARKLLAAWGGPEAVFEQSATALERVVTQRQARALGVLPEGFAAQLQATQRWLASANVGAARRIVTLGDAAYPPSLLAIEDPPLLLYLLGQVGDLGQPNQPDAAGGICNAWPAHAMAVVGSRSPTPQGAEDAARFARFLADAGCTVVSGLARGIDGAAHAGALASTAAAPATIAVVGTGLDRVYPAVHRELAQRIAEHGWLVSEYPLGTPPIAANFPKRNRLIAGLAQGVLVVEAALRSGSLITARVAAEQGKEVFAIPGSIHSPLARGCHRLIRDGAKLVETGADILEELRWEAPPALPPTADQVDEEGTRPLSDADVVLRALGADPASLDALQARTGLETAHLQARLLELELEGEVARLPGGLFQRMACS